MKDAPTDIYHFQIGNLVLRQGKTIQGSQESSIIDYSPSVLKDAIKNGSLDLSPFVRGTNLSDARTLSDINTLSEIIKKIFIYESKFEQLSYLTGQDKIDIFKEAIDDIGLGYSEGMLRQMEERLPENEKILRDVIKSGKTPSRSGINQDYIDSAKEDMQEFRDRIRIFKLLISEVEKGNDTFKTMEDYGNRNLYKVSIHKGKTPDQYDYLSWGENVTEEQYDKVMNELKKDFSGYDYNGDRIQLPFPPFKNYTTHGLKGQSLYNQLMNFLARNRTYILESNDLGLRKVSADRADEMASKYLLKAGIDGNKYATGGIGASPNRTHYNYVVFDENAITIDEHIKFQRSIFKDAKKQTKANLKKTKKTYLPYTGVTKEIATSSISQLEEDLNSEFGAGLPNGQFKLGKIDDNPENRVTFELAKTFGQQLIFVDTGNMSADFDFNALTNRQRIFVNTKSDESHSSFFSVGHELTHQLETESPELFDKLWDVINEETNNLDGVLREYADKYHNTNSNQDELFREFIGDVMGDAMQEKSFWDKVYKKSPELFKKLYDLLGKILKTLQFDKSFGARKFIKDMDRVIEVASDVMVEYAESKNKFSNRIPIDMFYPTSTNTQTKNERKVAFQKEKRDLYAVHNLNPDNIIHTDKKGGLANPSLAVIRDDLVFDSFGSITLIADKDLVDPRKGAKTYASDIYSPRYPSNILNFKKHDDFYKFRDEVIKSSDKIGIEPSYLSDPESFLSDIQRGRANHHDSLIAHYIVHHRLVSKWKRYISLYWKESPRYSPSLEGYKESNRGVNDFIIDNNLTSDVNEWWADQIDNYDIQDRIFKGFTRLGHRRYVENTLENITKLLRKDIRAGENFNYGVGSIRATLTPKFKSIKEIKESKSKLVSKSKFREVKDDANEKYEELSDKFAPFFKYAKHEFDTFADVLTDIGKGKTTLNENYEGFPDELRNELMQWLSELKNMPTEYFESKPNRIVKLNEFSKAVVPNNTRKKVRDILKRNNIEIIEYNNDKAFAKDRQGNRKQALIRASDLAFQKKSLKKDITKTKPFKDWFGDSKVVDENGKPLVVYHGTPSSTNLEVFGYDQKDKGEDASGVGFYLTSAPEEASSYADALYNPEKQGDQASPGVLPLYVSIKNPIRLNIHNKKIDDLEITREQAYQLLKRSPDIYDYDNTQLWNFMDLNAYDKIEDWMIRDIADSYKDHYWGIYNDHFSQEQDAFTTAITDVLGYDGVILDVDNRRHYVAFKPTQIKSATGNKGTFDKKNPGIRFQKKSLKKDITKTKPFKDWFGDSNVVDEKGEPLVVYHGTVGDFDSFGTPAYFSNYYVANEFAEPMYDEVLMGNNVMPVYLSLQNPKIYTTEEEYDDYVMEGTGFNANVETLKNQGFDGIIYKPEDIRDSTYYVAFEPTQIKSQFNQGTFDKDNPGIRFQKRSPEKDRPETINNLAKIYFELGTKTSEMKRGDKEYTVEKKPSKSDFIAHLKQMKNEDGSPVFSKKQIMRASKEFMAIKNYGAIAEETVDSEGVVSPSLTALEKKLEKLDEKVEEKDSIIDDKDGVSKEEKDKAREQRKIIKTKIDSIISGHALGQRDKKSDLKVIKKMIRDYAKETLPNRDIWKSEYQPFLTIVANAENLKDVQEAMLKIDAITDRVYKRAYRRGIRKLFKKGKLFKDNKGRVRGTMTADIQARVDEIKEIYTTNELEINDEIFQQQALVDKLENDPSTDEDVLDKAKERLSLLELFGNFDKKDLQDMVIAYANLEAIIKDGKSIRQEKNKIRRIQRDIRNQLSQGVITGDSKKPVFGRQERRSFSEFDDTKFRNKMKNIWKGASASIQGWDTLLDMLSYNDKSSGAFESFLNTEFGKILREADLKEQQGLREKEEALTNNAHRIYGLKRGIKFVKGKLYTTKKGILEARLIENENQVEQDVDIPNPLVKAELDKLEDLFDQELITVAEFKKREEAILKDNEKTVKIVVSQNELAQYWMWYQDESLRPTFDTMGWTEETIDQIEKALDPQVKEFAEYLLYEFYPSYYPEINEVYRKMFHVNMNRNPKYSHVSREVFGDEFDLGETLTSKGAFGSAYSPHLIARVNSKLAFSPTSMLDNVYNHIFQMEHFISHAEAIRDIRGTFSNETIRKAIEQYHGKYLLSKLDNLIDRVARGGVDPLLVHKLVDSIISNFVKAKIGVKPIIWLKQQASIPANLAEIPVLQMLKGLGEYAFNRKKARKLLMENSELLKSRGRGYSRDVRAVLKRSKAKRLADNPGMVDMMMFPAKSGDATAIKVGGYPVYIYHYRKKLKELGEETEENRAIAHLKGIEEFEIVSPRWQQSGVQKNLSYIQASGSFLKLITMFLNSPIQYLQQGQTGIRNLIAGRGKKSENIKRTVVAYGVLQASFNFISSAFEPPEDDEDWIDYWKELSISWSRGIPLVGSIAEYVMFRRWQFQITPIESMIPEIGKAFDASGNFIKALAGKVEFTKNEYNEMSDDILKIVGSFTGVAYEGISRSLKGVREVSHGVAKKKLKKVLGYSDSQLYGSRDKKIKYWLKDALENDSKVLSEDGLPVEFDEWFTKLLNYEGKTEKQKEVGKKKYKKVYRIRSNFGYDNKYVNRLMKPGLTNDEKLSILIEMNDDLGKNDFDQFMDNAKKKSTGRLISPELRKKYKNRNR